MIKIGLVGIGFMGRIHFLASQQLRDAKVTAIASRDAAKLAGDWTHTRGNFGPEPGMVNLDGIQKYDSLDALLADPEIDLVDICNPNHLHAETVIAALQAGKHVLVEKAIALTPEDADAMLDAARKAGKLLMVAHVLPFFPEFQYAAEIVRSGKYGKLLAAHFTRVISRPDWSSEMADLSLSGGPAIDLHIHDTHFIGLLCGVPQAVFATGVVERGTVTQLTTQYLYGSDGPSVTAMSGDLSMKSRPFVHGYEIFLEHATISYSSDGIPLRLLSADGVTHPTFPGGGGELSAFTTELQMAVDGVARGEMPELLSGQLARDALVMCYRECESVKSGKVIPIG